MSYNCEIVKKAEQPVLSIRTRTSVQELPNVLGKSYGAIAQYLGELGEQPVGATFAGYHNMDMQNLDVEIGFQVDHPLEGKGEIQSGWIPGGMLATCMHIGPYNAIEPAYNALMKFVEEQDHQVTGVAYEFYLNDPNETPANELQTQIVFPLKPT